MLMNYPELTDKYSDDFKLDGEYKASLPDYFKKLLKIKRLTHSNSK